MKYLIVGLGNIGSEYQNTRHNIGFKMLDAFAQASNIVFHSDRYGDVADGRVKNAQFVLLKPNTYMNLSGEAVRYWAFIEKIPVENILILVDDLALPFGTLRLRGQGSAGGHNGLKSVEQCLGTAAYARLRFGIGNDFMRGQQMDFVLGEWTAEEAAAIPEKTAITTEIIKSFCLQGLARTMNEYNKK